MKKYSKFLAIMLVFAMILPGIAQAAPVAGSTQVERVAGAGREETAIAASKVAYPTGATNVVLAGYAGEVDALTGTLLANEMKAPLLLTRAYKLTDATKAELTRLGAKKVYILGGEKVVEPKVVTELEAMNITVERIDGDNRYETAVMAGEKSGAQTKKVFLAKGLGILADALAVGPASAKEDMPVLLTQTDMVPEATMKALKDWGVTHITLVGGTSAISAKVETELKAMNITVDRVEGSDREKTAVAIADKYFAGSKNVIVANGYVYADALVGGYLGALQNAPIVLVDTNVLKASTEAHLAKADMAWILGGVNAVNDATALKVVAAVDDTAMELKVMSVSAINAKKVKVVFSQEVNSATGAAQAGLNTNYTITGKTSNDTAVTVSAVAVATDEKSAILTLSAPLKGNYAVRVAQLESKDDANVKTPLYTQDLSFTDTVKPTVTGTTYPAAGRAVIQMSEEVAGGSVTIARVDEVTGGSESAAISGTDASKIEVTNILSNVEYKVTMIGVKDMAGNTINPNPSIVNIKSTLVDTVKPEVVSIVPKGLDKIVVTFSEEVTSLSAITIKVDGVANASTAQVKNATNPKEVEFTLTTAVTPGLRSVEISTYDDLALPTNTGNAVAKNVSFKLVTAKLVKTEVAADNSNVKLTFDMPVTRTGTASITLVTLKDMITGSKLIATGEIAASGKVLTLTPAGGFTAGTKYTGKLTSADLVQLGINDEIAISFEAKAEVSDNKAIPAVANTNAQTVTVTYQDSSSAAVEMGASALDVNNYKVEGEKVFEKAIFTSANVVKLTLKPETVLLQGDYTMTIDPAVKSLAGKAIDAYSATHTFLENVAPKVKKAEFAAPDKVNLTFTENVTADADYAIVKVNGVKVAATVNAIAGTTDTAQITLATPITETGKTITVEFVKTVDVIDTNGNKLVPAASYTVTQ